MTIQELLEELQGLDPSTLVVLEQPNKSYKPAADTIHLKLVRGYHSIVLRRSEWPGE